MEKKRNGGHSAPATPAVPDPPVPNRARTEMIIGDKRERGVFKDPMAGEEKKAPEKRK